MKKNIAPAVLLSALLLTFSGCGSDSDNSDGTSLNLPEGKTMIFFDNDSSSQYSFNTDTEEYEDMNADANTSYNMEGKTGKLFTWFDHTPTGTVDQKILMLEEDYSFTDHNITYEDFHYLGHFHEEDGVKHFAAHYNTEFDPDSNTTSDGKQAALVRLNNDLAEREEIREELTEALPVDEVLCNFFVFDHDHEEDEDENGTEEAGAHIALTEKGNVYVYEENNETLELEQQTFFALDGVTTCSEERSAILKDSDEGVLIFSAESQKLYLVDNHGADFHNHSTWNVSKFLPEGFTPTGLAAIGEYSEDDHDH